MNKHLYMLNIRSNWIVWTFITFMLLLYSTIAVSMFNPDDAVMWDSLLNMLPEGMVKAFGFEGLGTELTGYISNYLYGFIYLIFPVIYTVITANKLIAKHVDSGSMTYLLTTPNSRIKIALTQAVFLFTSIFASIFVNVLIVILMSEIMFSGHLNIMRYIELNLVAFMTIAFVSSIGFFFSCLFNESRNSLALGAAIPMIFVVFKMLGNINDSLSTLKYFTIYSLIDIERILGGGSYAIITSLILFVITASIFGVSIYLFNKRSLAI